MDSRRHVWSTPGCRAGGVVAGHRSWEVKQVIPAPAGNGPPRLLLPSAHLFFGHHYARIDVIDEPVAQTSGERLITSTAKAVQLGAPETFDVRRLARAPPAIR